MSIPLDRLYHYIDDVSTAICNGDLVIYRFYPHGSKKIEDILPLKIQSTSWADNIILPNMICHDQEPLNFEMYNVPDQLLNHVISHSGPWVNESTVIAKMFSSMHLRSVLQYPLHCYDLVLLCHSEKNSKELECFERNGFLGVYWWSHAVIARDWFRYARHDTTLVPNFDNITKDFLIYNRAWSGTREYRLTLAEMLTNQELIEKCNVKFSSTDNHIRYQEHVFNNSTLQISRLDLHTHFVENIHTAEASADYEQKDYASCGIEIVLETLFDDTRWHLTEKTLRPIACGRPFILAATPGSLQYIKSYGFKTFDGLINESYDTVADPRKRLEHIVGEMSRIGQLPIKEKTQLWAELYRVAEYNKKLFFSDQWHQDILKEYCQNLQQAMTVMNQNKTAKYLQQITKEKQKNLKFKNAIDSTITSTRSTEELKQLYKNIGVDLL
jgi:hypothetical protein